MRTKHFSFQLEETIPGTFLAQGWLGGILTGYVYMAAYCLSNPTESTDVLIFSPWFLLLGTIIGLTYGLLSVGLVLIYRTNRIINFAQGELGAFGATLAAELIQRFHWPYVPAIGLSLIAVDGAFDSPTEQVYGLIPLTQVKAMTAGEHALVVVPGGDGADRAVSPRP